MSSTRFNFTMKSLMDIPNPRPGKRQYYYDTKIRALLLDVSSSKKSFYLYKKVRGRPERIFIGPFPDLSVEQARTKAMDLLSQIGLGINPAESVRESKRELTVAEMFNEYIERHAKKKCKTWHIMIQDFNRVLSPLATRQLSDVSRYRAEKLHQDLNESRGPYTANRMIQLLRAVYNKGVLWGYCEKNPFRNITLFPEKARERFLSNEEAARLIRELEQHDDSTLRDFIKLSLLTGVRKSNILSMRWSDIDMNEALWVIPDTKNGTSQTVTLGSFEIQILQERLSQKGESDFVFPSNSEAGHLVEIYKAWMRFRKTIGLADVTIHDLRRSLGSGMASQNVNIALVKEALHHKDLKTTINVYARTRKEAVRDAKVAVHTQWFADAGIWTTEGEA